MNNLLLRKYEEADEQSIAQITEPDYYEKYKEFSKQSISVAEKDGIIVGWLHLYVPDNSLYSCFLFIYVSSVLRRSGIGTFIYNEAKKQIEPSGCNWWSSYLESKEADLFALSVGFDYTNTNFYLVHSGEIIDIPSEGIREYTDDDYPAAPDIWSHEYADMHIRIGLPYVIKERTEEERAAERKDYKDNQKSYYVLEDNGIIIGIGGLFDDNSGMGMLAVDRTYVGKGYGTKLAAYITNECIRRGCKNPCTYCESNNANAMHIYKKIGYVEKSRESVALHH